MDNRTAINMDAMFDNSKTDEEVEGHTTKSM